MIFISHFPLFSHLHELCKYTLHRHKRPERIYVQVNGEKKKSWTEDNFIEFLSVISGTTLVELSLNKLTNLMLVIWGKFFHNRQLICDNLNHWSATKRLALRKISTDSIIGDLEENEGKKNGEIPVECNSFAILFNKSISSNRSWHKFMCNMKPVWITERTNKAWWSPHFIVTLTIVLTISCVFCWYFIQSQTHLKYNAPVCSLVSRCVTLFDTFFSLIIVSADVYNFILEASFF